jgi:hypothetical protein
MLYSVKMCFSVGVTCMGGVDIWALVGGFPGILVVEELSIGTVIRA